jgi:hypothetical protein
MELSVPVAVQMALIWNCVILLCSAEKELNLLILEPTVPDSPLPLVYHPSYAEGPALFLAAEIAAEVVNRNKSLLQGYHLNLLQEDSGCSVPFRAVQAFAEPFSRSALGQVSPIVGVVGPACSLSALSVSELSGRSEIALINIPLAGTHRLQNRVKYPYSFSIVDSSRLIAKALVTLTRTNDWSKVALFYDTSRQYFFSVVQMISEAANISEDYLEPVGISFTRLSPIHNVRNKFRIVFLLIGVELLSRIMCIAHHHDYIYPAYQYVVDTEVLKAVSKVTFTLANRQYHCTRDQVRMMLNGSILVNHQVQRPVSEQQLVTSSGISLQNFKDMYDEKVASNNVSTSLFGPLFYDAVWSFVLALDSAMSSTDIGLYGFGQPNVTNLIVEKMVGSSFEGLSGRIQYNMVTGHVDQDAQFFLINETDITEISYYNKDTDVITPYNSTLAVYIRSSFEEVILTVPKPLVYFTLLLILLAFLLTLLLNIATCVYRHVNSVKASSTNLSQVAFIGCYIHALSMLFAVVIYGFADSDVIGRGAICKIQHLLDFSLSIGLTVLLGAIFVRIWRLHRIFNRYQNPGKLLSDQYLILSIASLVIVDLALTVPAFFVSKYEPSTEENREANVIMIIITCKRSVPADFFLWFTSSLVISIILLKVILVLAILTRKIPQRNFKTNSIMYLSYMLTAVVPLAIGVYFIFNFLTGYASMVLRFCALCLLLICLILIPCAMLFFPPLLPILKQKKSIMSHISY